MDTETALFLIWLAEENGYRDLRLLPDGRWAGVLPLLFTHAIRCGTVGDKNGVSGHWCYRSREAARDALAAWTGEGEPEGWHRSPFINAGMKGSRSARSG